VDQVRREAAGRTGRPLVLLYRSGKRTVEAGQALEAAGFTKVIEMLHGSEGELDANFQRGRLARWRFDGPPWEQP
jgi:rhodanese-related sulfurtransferase